MEKSKLGFGIAIPQVFPTGEIDLSLISDFLSRTESLGYHSGWVQERVIGGLPTLDVIPLLSYAAAHTSRLELGTSVMLTALQSPVPLAKSLATLDQLSRGRLIVGVGLGGFPGVYPAFGLSPKARARRFEDGIRLMKRVWTEDGVSSDGRFWQIENASVNPKPFRKPHPPIWFGSHSPAALRRTARLGDGWMGAGSSSTQTFKAELKLLRQYLEEEGRDPSTFSLSKRVYVTVDRDKAGTSRRLQEWFGQHYGRSSMAPEVSVFGSAEECIEGLGEIVSEGIDLLMLNPVHDAVEQAEILARDVLPKLQP